MNPRATAANDLWLGKARGRVRPRGRPDRRVLALPYGGSPQNVVICALRRLIRSTESAASSHKQNNSAFLKRALRSGRRGGMAAICASGHLPRRRATKSLLRTEGHPHPSRREANCCCISGSGGDGSEIRHSGRHSGQKRSNSPYVALSLHRTKQKHKSMNWPFNRTGLGTRLAMGGHRTIGGGGDREVWLAQHKGRYVAPMHRIARPSGAS
jgi:hypothetical protein